MLFMYAAMIDDEVDQLRFADIYHGYRKQMLLVAKRVLNNDEDAEDAVQIAFLGIAQRIKSVPSDDPKKLRAYVLTAAKKPAGARAVTRGSLPRIRCSFAGCRRPDEFRLPQN